MPRSKHTLSTWTTRNPQNHEAVGRAWQFVGFQPKVCLSDKRTIETVQTITCAHIPACADLHRGVYDPDLRLPGTVGNGLKPSQKHIL